MFKTARPAGPRVSSHNHYKPRHCYYCRKPYYRREQIELWSMKNGRFLKLVVRACLTCSAFSKVLRRLV